MNNFQEADTGSQFNNFNAEPTPNPRQQAKLIKALKDNNPKIFREQNANILPQEKEQCLARIRSGEITPQDSIEIISHIRARFEDTPAYQIFLSMQGYDLFHQVKGLIAVATSRKVIEQGGYDSQAFHNRDAITYHQLRDLTDIYQNPADLEIALQPMLRIIEQNNNATKFTQYKKSLRVLMHAVYGKRAEYWEQYKLLYREAHAVPRNNDPEASNESLDQQPKIYSNEGSIALETPTDFNPESPKSLRARDELNANRIVPIIQLMVSAHKVPIIIGSDSHMHFYSVPENPDITDQQAEQIIRGIAREIHSIFHNEIDPSALKAKLLSAFQPSTFSRFTETGSAKGFATKNSIYRVLIQHLNDKQYFENI